MVSINASILATRRDLSDFFLIPISGRVDRASATEAVDSDLIPSWVKPKTIKIGINSLSA